MDKKTMMIAAVAVATIIAVAAVAVILTKNDNSDDGKEIYYFYPYLGKDGPNTHWYKATGDDAAQAFDSAMNDAEIDYKVDENGCIESINGMDGPWTTYFYEYVSTDKDAADASIGYPNFGKDGKFTNSNGWRSFTGYDADGYKGLRYSQIDANIFILIPGTVDTPVTLKDSWATDTNKDSPFVKNDNKARDRIYSFYLYLGEDDAKNGWYAAKATDATAAFDSAMKNAKIDYKVDENGYIGSIKDTSGYWMTYAYEYAATDKEAVAASIKDKQIANMGFSISNGWTLVSGYDPPVTGLKFREFDSSIFIISPYGTDPVAIADAWKEPSGANPFK